MTTAMFRFHDTPPDQEGGSDITRYVNDTMALSDIFSLCSDVMKLYPDVRAVTTGAGMLNELYAVLDSDEEIVGAADLTRWSLSVEHLALDMSTKFSTFRGTLAEAVMILFQIRLLWQELSQELFDPREGGS